MGEKSLEAELDSLHMEESLQDKIRILRKLQDEHDLQELSLEEELFALERKYHKLSQPLYDERAKIVCGDGPDGGIPRFWQIALSNHSALKSLMTPYDSKILEHLLDIRVEYLREQGPDFCLDLIFAKNDHFENDRITKSYFFEKNDKEFVFDHSTVTPIVWRREGSPCSIAHGGLFDTFLALIPTPSGDTLDEADQYNDLLMLDYEIGDIIKNRIVPAAVDYYSNLVRDEDYDSLEE